MQTIDPEIRVEITVIMQIVGAQQHACYHHAAFSHNNNLYVFFINSLFYYNQFVLL